MSRESAADIVHANETAVVRPIVCRRVVKPMEVEVTSEQLALLMSECGFELTPVAGISERVYQRVSDRYSDIVVRVHSSVPICDDMARVCMPDTFRVVLVHLETGRILWVATRVSRTQGWSEKLRDRLHEACGRSIEVQRCSVCGGVMLESKLGSGAMFPMCSSCSGYW